MRRLILRGNTSIGAVIELFLLRNARPACTLRIVQRTFSGGVTANAIVQIQLVTRAPCALRLAVISLDVERPVFFIVNVHDFFTCFVGCLFHIGTTCFALKRSQFLFDSISCFLCDLIMALLMLRQRD